MKRAAAAFWFLIALTGMLCIGWIMLVVGIVRQDADGKLLGTCVLGIPALILTMRDSVRAWKAAPK